MKVAANGNDPLSGGFYSARDAARLLGIDSVRRVNAWLQGYPRSGAGAVVARDYPPGEGEQTVSFRDLLEIRFLDHFRRQGVSLQHLRRVAEKARVELQSRHPFALSGVRFVTDRKKVFRETADETGDKVILGLVDNQYEMYEAIERVLARGVAFDPASHLATTWHPRAEFPHVVLDPRVAFGRPSIENRNVPTVAIVRLIKAEGSISRAARWFGLTDAEANEAFEFEVNLAKAA